MATYAEKTDAEKNTIAQAERWLRGWLLLMAANDLDLKITFFNDNVAPILATLDPGEVIPNSSGLAGAQDLTHEQLTALKNWVSGISGDIETNKSLLVKAIGVNA